MKNNKRSLTLAVLALALITVIALNGTLAYFMDKDTVRNTFTMGKIKISLTEPGWSDGDGLGLLPGNVRTKDPTVTAVSGESYMRIRMEIVDGDGDLIADAARLALILDTLYYDTAFGTAQPNLRETEKYACAELAALVAQGKIQKGFNAAAFAFAGIKTGSPAVRYYHYRANGGIFDAAAPADKAVLFTHVVIPKDWNNREILELNGCAYALTPEGVPEATAAGSGYSIILTAEAIQSAEMANAAEAFSLLDNAAGITRDTSGT